MTKTNTITPKRVLSYTDTQICQHLNIVTSENDDCFDHNFKDDEIVFCQDCNKVEFVNPEIRKVYDSRLLFGEKQ